ncbi:histidine kinase dimerization/phospho-acceptor domain-containing protein [Oleiagrimonas sp. C23AA]|uniref:histidine kinase dimerization/phospho-acceptor domain-containing protein n=1 Tax=Oleiagrimonas sp. C23AA TaxID=2719047 RepID=UPI001420B504|nr:histidine kinase dimerization/phospho-acceptor domain-containing protein [Oleiagrimonas sp. C23AA]NII11372.1 sensor histidine kinase [Oleiagrimonas sp. C23AA]
MWSSELSPPSIRLRLLLFLCTGLGVLMVGLFLLLDRGVDRQIYGRLDHVLEARAHAIAVLLESHPASEALAELQAMSPEYAGGGHTDFLQLWSADGATLLASGSNRGGRLTPPGKVPANQPYFYDLRLPDGHRGRAVAVRVGIQGHAGDAILAVAEEREQVDALERHVHIALLSGVVATSLFAVLLAVLAVRGGLRPLMAFGNAARRGGERVSVPLDRLPRELRPLAGALNDAFARLAQALHRERRFARDVAHELRTPLAEIRTAVELVRRDVGGSSTLDGALESTQRMQRCIDGLLSLSRYESGMQEVQLEPVDLAALLTRSVQLAAGPATRRRIRLECQAPAECWVQTDPALLERVIDNLLLNAAEHAPEDSVVAVHMRGVADAVRLSIGNLAPALEDADLQRLGERFWRKSPAREASGHGGLGLALAQGLAALLQLRLSFRLDRGWLWADLEGMTPLALPG